MKNKFLLRETLVFVVGLIVIPGSIFFFGCSKGASSSSYDYNAMPQERQSSISAEYIEDSGMGGSGSPELEQSLQNIPAENSTVPMERKLVKNASLSIEADSSLLDTEGKLQGVQQKVDELMKKFEAYSEHTWSEENSSRFTIRVPEIHYASLISETSTLGKIKSRTETAEDVTLQYYDYEGRLETKKTLLATFQGYLGRARDIDDIMKVETRIAELQNEIDWLGNQLTRLSNLVDYATVELSIYSARHTSDYTLGDRIRDLFGGYGDFAGTVLVVLLGIVIFAIPVVIIILLAFWLLFGRVGILKKAFRLVMRGREKNND